MSYKIEIAKGSLACALGEGPHWNAAKKELLYVDILGQGVLRYVPATQECYRVSIECGTVSLVVPVDNTADQYVLGIGRTIQLMEWDGKSPKPTSLKILHTVDKEDDRVRNRFNDGKCDSQGRLYAGTMGYLEQSTLKLDENKGTLYSIQGNKVNRHFGSIDISNGLAWSPDDKVMYYIDSFTYRVDAHDYDGKTGILSNPRSVFDLKAEGVVGVPDGMTIDADGNLWIALFDGGKVIHVDPISRKKIGEVKVPTGKVTSVAFGDPQLDTLYITTASKFRKDGTVDPEPGAGELYAVKNLGVKGLAAGYGYKAN